MKQLISNSSVLRFKIKRFKNPSGTLTIDWTKQVPVGLELTDRAIAQVRAIVLPMELKVEKASKKNKNIAAKLLEMWNMGAFKGVIDRKTGKEVTFERAVDGIPGRMTKEAEANRDKIWRNGLNFTSFSSLKKSSVLKTNNKSNLSNLYSVTHSASTGGFSNFVHAPYKDSLNTGLQAIFDHKRNLNVGSNYAVIDKINKTLNIYNKDKLLESHSITIGSEIGDGMAAPKAKYLSEVPRTTGAGVFTIKTYPTSDYLGNEPMLELHPDFVSKIVLAIHSPASMNRLRTLKDPKSSKRVSYGCASPDCGVVKRIYDNKILQDNDTVYVLPEISGNELIESKGKLRMRWNGNNPETYDNGKKRFIYNNKR